MDIYTRALKFISPKAAFNRMKYITAAEGLDRVRKYDGAALGRRTAGLPTQDGSANTETASGLALLRSRSRHFARNNSYAKKGFNSITNNTVGKGIQARIKPVTAGKKSVADEVAKEWKRWSGSRACDFDDRMNFAGIQKLVMRTVAEAGECIVMRRRTGNDKIPFELQLLEPDFLDPSKNNTGMSGNGDYTVQGIQYNADGKRTGYWIFPRNPYEFGAHSSRLIPAEDILHIYELIRPGQARGVPFLHSAMLRLADFDDYEDAELVRAKIASCFVAFVHDADPAATSGGTSEDDLLDRMEPGIIETLSPGKSVTFGTPPVTQNYNAYSRSILQGVAAGMGITYEALTGDLSNVNFSSGRMGWLEMHRQITDWQTNMLVPQLCDRVFEWFIQALYLNRSTANDVEVQWTPPRREMIDPVKETEALKAQLRSGLISWPDAILEMGDQPETVIEEIKMAMDLFDKNKIVLDSDGRNPDGGPSGNEKAKDGATAKKVADKVTASAAK